MSYLIDGHNLIPKMPGLSLRAMDDEIQLIEILQIFCRNRQKQVEVFFDNAPAGQPKQRKFGRVKAIFVPAYQTADQAISKRLKQLGKNAKNTIVISSDRQVLAEARANHAKTQTSEAFANLLIQDLEPESPDEKTITLQEDEIAEWLSLFQDSKDD